MSELPQPTSGETPSSKSPSPLNSRQRRILGVLMEKARTTPDAYPLSLNGLVTGCNQKSNRHPIMNLTSEQVEDEIAKLREAGVAAEIHGGGRVPKYRHYGYDYLGVKGAEAAILTELLLRGEQTAGELRTRASRFEPIADLQTLQSLLDGLIERGLVVALTPPGRGQMFTHNLYQADELERLKQQVSSQAARSASQDDESPSSSHVAPSASGSPRRADPDELQSLRDEVRELRSMVEQLTDRIDQLMS